MKQRLFKFVLYKKKLYIKNQIFYLRIKVNNSLFKKYLPWILLEIKHLTILNTPTNIITSNI